MKKTPLYEQHIKLGGKIIDFGGALLPVQYEGIIAEHNRVRNAAGLFDVSHLGEIAVKGAEAEKFIQYIVTNDISELKDFQMIYSPICYPEGGSVDDVIIYKFGKEDFLIVVNAVNIDKDFEWMRQNNMSRADVENVSGRYAQIALQGPKAEEILQKLTDYKLNSLKFFHFAELKAGGISAIVSRSGYTGEDGFEIYILAQDANCLWESLLEAGAAEGLVPVGLGARDTLRLEAALPLYGHEQSADITPLEAELEKYVQFGKEKFIGKEALLKQSQGLKRKLVGFEMTEAGVPRNGFEVRSQGRRIGYVTSGTYSPTLGKNIGLAIVETPFSAEGTQFDIAIRNKESKAKVVKKPFYSKKYKK